MAPRPGRSRLPYLLDQKRIKRVDLAIHLGVTPAFITMIIKGERYFSYPLAAKAAHYFNCSMEELHEWIDD
ncbi:helix-turn-helix transcriptional regulator [Paenibacillus massiliensis]|uniref:helix-turn-helix transcriptional regulator n=1 Tax=Paenibacillus massiliensis TaxID=225917 RepID=UPI00146D5D01